MVAGIAHLADLEVSSKIQNHRFYLQLVESLERKKMRSGYKQAVLGTCNVKRPELYGWSGSVPMHTDKQGIVYFVVLNDISGVLSASGCESIQYKKGTVIRMNDFEEHSVSQVGDAFALFVGAYNEPRDQLAIDALKEGLRLLESESDNYYAAPRYLSAKMQDDECMAYCQTVPPKAAQISGCENTFIIKREDVEKLGAMPLQCAHDGCDRMASYLDNHYPYFWDRNLCEFHGPEN